MKELGFFREFFDEDDSLPSIILLRGTFKGKERAAAAKYLAKGHVIAATGADAPDIFSGEPRVSNLYRKTDGVWVWPGYLAYYVQRYGISLPQEFIEHAAANGWRVPKMTRAQRFAAIAEYLGTDAEDDEVE